MSKRKKMSKAKRRKMRKGKETFTTEDFMRANRIGSKQAEQECEGGFVSRHKVHKSKKTYSRKNNEKYA